MVRSKNERRGDFHARMLGKSEVSGIPVEELRGAKLAYCFPESEQEETERNRRETDRVGRSLVCDENEGEEKCNERFANYRQLKHKTRKHGVRTVLGLLTRTNECPWCRSRFVDHVYNATETKGKCYINFSRWHRLPDDLQCRLCDHEAQDFEEFQLHARSHHARPAMSAWRVSKRATLEGEGVAARETASCPRMEARDQ